MTKWTLPASAWRPIEDAPKDGTLVIGAWRYGGWSYAVMRYWGGWTKPIGGDAIYTPTHFMPLPQPPEADT